MSTPRGMPGSAGDELFLPSNNNNNNQGVAPLRINKRPTSFDNQSNTSSGSGSHASIIAENTPLPYPNPRRPTFPQQDYSPEETDRPPLPYPDKPAHERNKIIRQDSAVPGLPQLPYPALDPFAGRNNRYSYADTLPSPSPSSSSTISTTSTVPGRHVSVKESDDFPIPPPFRQYGRDDSDRPINRIPKKNVSTGRFGPDPSSHPSNPNHDDHLDPPVTNPYPEFHQQYWPASSSSGSGGRDNANKYNARPESTVSVMTTAGRRGSPAPPETPATATTEHPPVTVFGGRTTPTPARVTAHSPPPRPWTPTEAPGSAHAPPTIYQGPGRQNSPGQGQQQQQQQRPEPQRQESQHPALVHPSQRPQEQQHPSMVHPSQRQEQQQQQQQQQQFQQQQPLQPQQSGPRPGASPVPQGQPRPEPAQVSDSKIQSLTAVEQDFDRLNLSASPPPSYASLGPPPTASQPSSAQGYPNEKQTLVLGTGTAPQDLPDNQGHPAFQAAVVAEPSRASAQPAPVQQQPAPQPQPAQPAQQPQPAIQNLQHQAPQFTPPPGPGPSSPPPLPEGWMAHLDQSSGQYYYIHIPTQRTQWEFPQAEVLSPPPQMMSPPPGQMMSPGPSMMSPGPSMMSPGPSMMSPGPSMMSPPPSMMSPPPGMMSPPPGMMFSSPFPGQQYGSPMPMGMGYSDPNMMMSPPPQQMFNQPPPPTLPSQGIAMYNIAPANGDYFGPYLRYTNMDIENGVWLGSIMIVTQDQPPTIHLHESLDLSPNPRQLKAHPIFAHRTWSFYRYDIDIHMSDAPAKWTYAVTSHLGCTRFEFLVAGRFERSWRFVAHSCNDFSVSVSAQERTRLGGVGFMWKDLLQKHMDVGGFHAQVGLGDQIYADRIWKELPLLRDWLHVKGKEQRKAAPWTAAHEEETTHAYFHYYSSHFDQPFIREAFAQIPHLFQLDDHDIFDGYGSYPEHLQFSNMFKNIGRIAYQFYLLFQHHTTLDILRQVPDDRDLFTITGTGWHFIKYLGPTIAIVGIDNRSERNQHQVMAGPTYQGLFPKIANVHPAVQHVLIMVGVPIIYPRMASAESFVNTVATTKKVANGTYNFLGKAVGSVAGVVGAKQVVGEAFNSVKKGIGKHGLMSSVVSVFGEVDVLDDLRDHWTHESKDLERTYFIRTLQGIAHNRSIRITFLSGDVHTCGAGLVHDPMHPSDHKTMYQIITSGIVNVPPPPLVMKLLHSPQILHIPQNGVRSSTASSDTKEEMIELFQQDVTGQPRDHKKLMNRRNYAIFIPFDPVPPGAGGSGAPPLSLAVDFIVQNEGIYSPPAKYGPVVVPRLEFGH